MKIANKKTGREYEVTSQDWELMGEKGMQSRFKIVEGKPSTEAPKEAATVDRSALVAAAKVNYEEGKLDEAIAQLEQAQAMKPTQAVGKTLAKYAEEREARDNEEGAEG